MSPLNLDKNSEFISLSEAVTLVTYTRDYLGRLAREGKIISKQINKQWFVKRDSLINFFEHSALEDSVKKRILSVSRKNDLEVKEVYKNKVGVIEARTLYLPNASLFATILIIAGGLFGGIVLERSGQVLASNPHSSLASVGEVLSVVSSVLQTQTATIADTRAFTSSMVVETDEKIPMEGGIVIFPAGDSRAQEAAVTVLFSDDVEVVLTSTTTGLVKMTDSETALPFVRVPKQSQP